jgi:hypothetical protein
MSQDCYDSPLFLLIEETTEREQVKRRDIDGLGSVWEIYRGKSREQLLALLIKSFPQLIFGYESNPIEDKIRGTWTKKDHRHWTFPSDIDIKEVLDWLYLGEWILYPSTKVIDIPYINNNDKKMLSFMNTNHIPLVVLSFSDDDFWLVFYSCGILPTNSSSKPH